MSKSGPITEGLAAVLPIETNEVFYNPTQVFNRDLSVLAISVFGRSAHVPAKTRNQTASESVPLTVFEGLAASGLRSIRYVKELKWNAFTVTANDIEKIAVERITKNAAHNGIPLGSNLFATNEDAILHLHMNKGKYDVIDLDPYGSCSVFLDAAVGSVKPNGLLCITSTDGGVLCGNQPDMAYIRYGGFSLKKGYAHEMGLRVMIHSIASAAARHKRGIKILAALSIDFYFRVFVQVIDRADSALASMLDTGLVFQCTQCEYHATHALGRMDGPNRKANRFESSSSCPECNGALSIGGPMYLGSLSDEKFVNDCFSAVENESHEFPGITSWAKIKALLFGLQSELPDVPLFYSLAGLAGVMKVSPPKLRVFQFFLERLGYRAGGSHRTPNVIKTNAPSSVVYDLMRMYIKTTGIKAQPIVPGLIEKPISLELPEDLEELDWNMKIDDKKTKVAIHLPNPKRFWGPKARAVITADGNTAKKQKLIEAVAKNSE